MCIMSLCMQLLDGGGLSIGLEFDFLEQLSAERLPEQTGECKVSTSQGCPRPAFPV